VIIRSSKRWHRAINLSDEFVHVTLLTRFVHMREAPLDEDELNGYDLKYPWHCCI
jgi:hypothetical protein